MNNKIWERVEISAYIARSMWKGGEKGIFCEQKEFWEDSGFFFVRNKYVGWV